MDSEKQTEGFRVEGGGGCVGLVMGIKEGMYFMVLYINDLGTLHQKLMMYCMVTNIT